MDIVMLGVDLGKNVYSVAGLDPSGRVVLRRRMKKETFIEFARQWPLCVVAMEACCGAHHLGRQMAAQGHEVRLMSPEYVRPYVKAQKNDDRDAEAIAEAATRPTMRFVALKSEAQLDVQVLHRVRDRLVGDRTALMKIRGILLERGIVVPQGRRKLLDALSALSSGSEDNGIGPRMRRLLDDMLDPWRALDERIAALDDEFAEMARDDAAARRLATIPGIGVLNATALVAAIGDGRMFNRGRDLSAWLGLVPRQATTGGKPKLLGITKRGTKYLRKLIIPGARAALPSLARTTTCWVTGCAVCFPERTPTWWSSRWRASSLGSLGRSCNARLSSLSARSRRHRTRSACGAHPTSPVGEGLWVVEARWPDSQPVSRKPMALNGTRCRPPYEARDARISILARVRP